MLSKEQQDIIENSIWVVNTALKKQGLQADEDMRQSAILYMCKCIERFDPTKNIKWTTFAYKNIYLYIKRTHNKELERQRWLLNDDLIYKIEDGDFFDASRNNNANTILEVIKRSCTPEEREFIELKVKGYKGVEIGQIMRCSTSKVICHMQSIKHKAKEIVKNK